MYGIISVENYVFAYKVNERSACEQAPLARCRKPERVISNMPTLAIRSTKGARDMKYTVIHKKHGRVTIL